MFVVHGAWNLVVSGVGVVMLKCSITMLTDLYNANAKEYWFFIFFSFNWLPYWQSSWNVVASVWASCCIAETNTCGALTSLCHLLQNQSIDEKTWQVLLVMFLKWWSGFSSLFTLKQHQLFDLRLLVFWYSFFLDNYEVWQWICFYCLKSEIIQTVCTSKHLAAFHEMYFLDLLVLIQLIKYDYFIAVFLWFLFLLVVIYCSGVILMVRDLIGTSV